MDKAIKILVDEHENILILADSLERECDKVGRGKKINEEFFKNAVDFIRNYADKFHHAKEEEILFKEFCKTAEKGCLHCNPVEQMLYEHNIGREFVKGMENGLKEKNKDKIIENSKGYINLIREHIFKENNILYPMAEEALSNDIKKGMLKKFNDVGEKNKSERKRYLSFIKNHNV